MVEAQRQRTDFCKDRSYTHPRRYMPRNIPQRIPYVWHCVLSVSDVLRFLLLSSFYSMEMIAVDFALLNEPLEASKKKEHH